MKKICSGTYKCDHGFTFTKSDITVIVGYKSGLPINIPENDTIKHLKECGDSGVSEKIGKYSRENIVGPEINAYDKHV